MHGLRLVFAGSLGLSEQVEISTVNLQIKIPIAKVELLISPAAEL